MRCGIRVKLKLAYKYPTAAPVQFARKKND